jgi:hypothetical protein
MLENGCFQEKEHSLLCSSISFYKQMAFHREALNIILVRSNAIRFKYQTSRFEWVALLPHVWEVPGSNLGPETSYRDHSIL